MHLAVAIEAAFPEHILIGRAVAGAAAVVGQAGVERGGMTLLAHKGGTGGQQVGVNGTMWFVTITAVFGHRWVLPQMRSALFRVAAITGVI